MGSGRKRTGQFDPLPGETDMKIETAKDLRRRINQQDRQLGTCGRTEIILDGDKREIARDMDGDVVPSVSFYGDKGSVHVEQDDRRLRFCYVPGNDTTHVSVTLD